MSSMQRLRAIDLFCGCGGFSLGAHEAGFDVASAYDVDATLTSSFKKNFSKTELHLRDVSTLTGAEIRSDAGGEVDLQAVACGPVTSVAT